MSLLAFKNNHELFMVSFFLFFILYICLFYFVTGGFPDMNKINLGSCLLLLGIPVGLVLAGLVKYLIEKYIQKRKVSFLLLK